MRSTARSEFGAVGSAQHEPPRGGENATADALPDVSETVVLNASAKIINVQWDFDYRGAFKSTQGFSFVRTAKNEPALIIDYTFPAAGRYHVACKVQDDVGGEGLWTGYVEVK